MENKENMKKVENINQMTQNTLFVTRNKNIRARRTCSRVTSKWENIKRNVEPCLSHVDCGKKGSGTSKIRPVESVAPKRNTVKNEEERASLCDRA